ncbi:MAG: ATP-binding protein [Candidatus Bathyarchaeota archaeon]|nr:ATP-binding protein [Candidatus Bathyarchaeota archaeon]
MFFDPRPKIKKEDLYGRNQELAQFQNAITYAPLIVITGLRRTGKTSFLNVAMAESKQPYTIMDLRGLPYNPSNADIVRRLETAFNRVDKQWLSGLTGALKHLRGISIMGNEITFGWGKTGVDLPEFFSKINDWTANENKHFLVAFDEIQIVRGDKWIPQLFAHVADSYRNITLVLTGSECGLMFDFLGFDNPNAPLYGRDYVQIQMNNFSEPQSRTFLESGFQQINISCSPEVINYALANLDGIAGWLTLFGSRCLTKQASSKEIVDEVVSEAGRLARAEALKLTLMSRRYGVALNFLAGTKAAGWGQVKSALEAKEGHSLTGSMVSKLLNALVKSGFAVKAEDKYAVADPLLVRGIRDEPLPE